MMKRMAYVVGVLFLLASLLSLSKQPVVTAATQTVLKPTADTYVNASYSGTNYGTQTTLRVDGSPVVRGYLRFNLSTLSGIFDQVKLRIYANSASSSGIGLYTVSSITWGETTTTYANAPALGSLVSTSSAVSAATWKEFDVTKFVTAGSQVSFALTTTGSTAISLASRESGANSPQLVITSAAATSTATSLPSPSPTSVSSPTRTATTATTLTPTSAASPTLTPTVPPTQLVTSTPTQGSDVQPTFPIRAAFYYPWFPEAWTQQGIYPYTNYTPTLGYYSNYDSATIKKHIAAMQYGGIQAGISSWWGQGDDTDVKFAGMLGATAGSSFRWALYYEDESLGDPTVDQLQNDLTYIRDRYGKDPSYLRVNGKFVIFVYADANDGCGMADRWKQANTVGAYVVLKVFAGYAACASQPDSWHQYSPAVAADSQGNYSYTISPGFWLKGNTVRLARDLTRFAGNIKDMIASKANWQLVTTFNEWGEGTIVESAQEWTSPSGYGQYLDALHNNGQIIITPTATSTTVTPAPTGTLPPTLTPTPPPASPTPTQPVTSGSLKFTPAADAYVDSTYPNTNYGSGTTLRVDGSPVVRAYLRFNVAGVSGAVTRATLRFYANSASSSGISAWGVSSNSWTETGLTYAAAPAPGSTLGTTGAVTAATWKEIDVTAWVKANGTFSLGLSTTGSTAISLASHESGANAPQLVVSYSTIGSTSTPTPTVNPTQPTSTPTPATLLAAGDIAKCGGGTSTPAPGSGAKITSDMLLNASGNLFSLGDNSNDSGSEEEYSYCFDPTWGRLKDRLIPVIGNHEQIYDSQARPYFNYFGPASRPATYGHFSLNLGAWHIVVLSSNCGVGSQGCGAGSIQEQWLRADLAANTQKCTLAIWHAPLFTSGTQSANTGMKAFWQALYDYHADVILNGHNHNYERFAPQDPNAVADPANGLREFVVGTGGASLDKSSFPMAANEQVRSAAAYGYLQLTLKTDSYDWSFVAQPGSTFTDSGSGNCH